MAALVTLPLAFELMMISKERWQRIYSLGCLCLTMLAIMLGASRGGFLGIVVGLGYLVFRSENRARNIAVISVVIVPFLLFAPNSPVRRFLHPVVGDTASIQKHIVGWKAGLNMIAHNPLTGVGLGNYKLKVAQYDTTGTVRLEPHIAHNAYLEIAAEMGIPALGLYVIFMLSAFFSLDRTQKALLEERCAQLGGDRHRNAGGPTRRMGGNFLRQCGIHQAVLVPPGPYHGDTAVGAAPA